MKNNNEIKQNKDQVSSYRKGQRGMRELEDGLDPYVLARQVLIKGENRRIFIDFVLKIREKMVLSSKMEEELLKKYIFSGWKLRRMREIEKGMLNKQQVFDSYGHDFSEITGEKSIKRRIRNLSKIELNEEIKATHIEQEKLEKQMVKALRQLREEQNLKNLER